MIAEQLSATPKITFVVLCSADAAILKVRLHSLAPLCVAHAVELMVVVRSSAVEGDELRDSFPSARFVYAAPEEAEGSSLRRRAIAEAGGDVVAFCDDADARACDRLVRLIETYGLRAEPTPEETGEAVKRVAAAGEEMPAPQLFARSPAYGTPLRESASAGDLRR